MQVVVPLQRFHNTHTLSVFLSPDVSSLALLSLFYSSLSISMQWLDEGNDPGTSIAPWPSDEDLIAMGRAATGL